VFAWERTSPSMHPSIYHAVIKVEDGFVHIQFKEAERILRRECCLKKIM
jgi:hypothetical protein